MIVGVVLVMEPIKSIKPQGWPLHMMDRCPAQYNVGTKESESVLNLLYIYQGQRTSVNRPLGGSFSFHFFPG